MIVSRSLSSAILSKCLAKNLLSSSLRNNPRKQIIRGSHGEFTYRKPAGASVKSKRYGIIVSAVFWWWITWHLLTDYHELLVPHFPDPSEWTDEELGIPPDDAD